MMKRKLYNVLSASHKVKQGNPTIVTATPSVQDGIKPLEDIPGPGGIAALPYIGPMFLFHPFSHHKLETSNLVFTELNEKYGSIVKLRKGKKWSIFLFDPIYVEQAFKHEGKYPMRSPMPLLETYSRRKGRKPGLSLMEGQEWHKVRRAVQRHISKPSVATQYLPLHVQVADEMIECIGKSRGTSIEKLLLEYTAESTAQYCFNSRCGFLDKSDEKATLANQTFLENVQTFLALVAHSFYTFPLFKYYPTKLYRRFEAAADHIFGVAEREVLSAYTKQNQCPVHNTEQKNLLHDLLQDNCLDIETICSLTSGFFSVATENVAKQLTIFLWILAKHQAKQDKLHEEIRKLCVGEDGITTNVLSRMPYLKSCFKESCRLVFPTPLGTVRVLPEDCTIGEYHVPAGTTVHFASNTMCRNPKYFSNPDQYVPERWLQETDTKLRRQQSFIVLPFGFGPRNCLAKHLAENQIYVVIIKMLLRYKVRLANPEEELKVSYKIQATLNHRLDLIFEER